LSSIQSNHISLESAESTTDIINQFPFSKKHHKAFQNDPPVLPNEDKLQDGLAKLVLTIVKVLLDVIERQAIRRVESGTLSDGEIEKLGASLMKIKQKFDEMSQRFGFKSEELTVAFRKNTQDNNNTNSNELALEERPSHSLSTNTLPSHNSSSGSNNIGLGSESLVEIIDTLINKKATLAGEVTVSVAGIDLIVLRLLATLEPVLDKRNQHSSIDDYNRILTTQKRKKRRSKNVKW